MKIYSVFDKEFKDYGVIVDEDFSDILSVLKSTECPENRTVYTPSYAALESTESYKVITKRYYGNMPVQLGYCNGHNNKLNCLEYHKDSEINVSPDEFILLLGLRSEIEDGKFDTSLVKAFKVPAGTAVEVFSTSLHYAPVGANGNGFRVLIALPRGTNVSSLRDEKDPLLFMTNKWLLAHKDSPEAASGAYVGLTGNNIEI